MAPVTRQSRAAYAGKKVPTRKASSRQHTQLERNHSNGIDVDEDDDLHGSTDDNINGSMHNGDDAHLSIEAPQEAIRATLNPLREIANKIGQEVEKFAISLDMYLQDITKREDRFQAAQDLVLDFKNIAQEAVDNLKSKHEKERAKLLRIEWSKQTQLSVRDNATSSMESILNKTRAVLNEGDGSVQELRAWQEEVDLWELFSIILEIHYRPSLDPDGLQAENLHALSTLRTPHRYTTELELWQRFLLEDRVGKERSLIKRWLEEAVDHQDSGISGIVEELESGSSAGKGLWTKGWMHTREKIKGEKRLRSWPSASDSIQPQIRRSDNNELLITQLDPDAPTKHQRALEKPDVYFERATWIVLWEMLRRGAPSAEINAWCEDRNEGWRAVALGRVGEADETPTSSIWKRMCLAGSVSGGLNEYEAAVYGLLGGNPDPVIKIARTVDDHLYAHYSSQLLQQFERYRKTNFPELSSSGLKPQITNPLLQDPERAQQTIVNLIARLRQRSETRSEALRPMKIIQSYLMANELESMINTVGEAIGQADKENGLKERLILRPSSTIQASDVDAETEVALNPQATRIVAHMAIVLATIRSETLLDQDLAIEENVLVSYIQQLRVALKRDLIPVYASRLSTSRNIVTMSDVLKDVKVAREQEQLMQLMSEYYHFGIDRIFWEQTLDLTDQMLENDQAQLRLLPILEKTDEKEYPGQRVMLDFLPEELEPFEATVISSLQWFLLLPGYWKLTFEALSLALRKCLVVGRFSCAMEIVRQFPYDSVSMQKSYQVLGISVNLMDESVSFPDDGEEAMSWQVMQQQSRSYYELELLVRAVEKLSMWAQLERPYVSKRPTPSPIPSAIKQAKQDVVDAMQYLIDGILTQSRHEDEAADFAHIRQAYLPEVIIAYNTVLYTAGTILTRDALLESMDLSVSVAREENGLADCIMRAGRMRELVASFAQSSKAMLLLKAQSTKQWKPRKDREGKDPSIWEIGPQDTTGNAMAIVHEAVQS